jgi:hypothetical protein
MPCVDFEAVAAIHFLFMKLAYCFDEALHFIRSMGLLE